MESDPLYSRIKDVLNARPLQAGPLFTAFKDLSLSVEWRDLRVTQLEGTSWAIIIGRKRKEDNLRAVLPIPLHTTSLKPSSLRAIFKALTKLDIESIPVLPPLAPDLDSLRSQLAAMRSGSGSSNEDRDISQDDHDKSAVHANTDTDDLAVAVKTDNAAGLRPTLTLDAEMLYMAIVASDSTVVYYKLSKGIKKPADIPDE